MKKIVATLLCLCCVFSLATAQTLYPANGALDAPFDAQLRITFAEKPVVNAASKVEIFDASGNIVDTILAQDETQSFSDETVVNVGSQLIRAENATLYITPHNGKLQPGATYSVKFPGIEAWQFTTKAMTKTFSDGAIISVDNNPNNTTADFASIQAALDAVSTLQGTYTLSIAPGTYYELLHYIVTVSRLRASLRFFIASPEDRMEYWNRICHFGSIICLCQIGDKLACGSL